MYTAWRARASAAERSLHSLDLVRAEPRSRGHRRGGARTGPRSAPRNPARAAALGLRGTHPCVSVQALARYRLRALSTAPAARSVHRLDPGCGRARRIHRECEAHAAGRLDPVARGRSEGLGSGSDRERRTVRQGPAAGAARGVGLFLGGDLEPAAALRPGGAGGSPFPGCVPPSAVAGRRAPGVRAAPRQPAGARGARRPARPRAAPARGGRLGGATLRDRPARDGSRRQRGERPPRAARRLPRDRGQRVAVHRPHGHGVGRHERVPQHRRPGLGLAGGRGPGHRRGADRHGRLRDIGNATAQFASEYLERRLGVRGS